MKKKIKVNVLYRLIVILFAYSEKTWLNSHKLHFTEKFCSNLCGSNSLVLKSRMNFSPPFSF